MKKAKRVLCLVLALAMVFALAVPAFAAEEPAEDEGVEVYSYVCPQCHYALKNGDFLVQTATEVVAAGSCENHSLQHGHTVPVTQNRDVCSKCGYISVLGEFNGAEQCPYTSEN